MKSESIWDKLNPNKRSSEAAREKAPVVGSVKLPLDEMNSFNRDKDWSYRALISGFNHDAPPSIGELVKVSHQGKESLAVISRVGSGPMADSMTRSDNSFGFEVELKNPKHTST